MDTALRRPGTRTRRRSLTAGQRRLLRAIGWTLLVMLAIVPADFQYHDTYFVVAHFHYVLVTGALFAIIAAVYYWWPKWTGRMYSQKLADVHFWVSIVFVNLLFFPQHFLGLAGMPRRIPDYNVVFADWNLISSAGAFGMFLTPFLMFFILWQSKRSGPLAAETRRKLELFPDIHVDVLDQRGEETVGESGADLSGTDRVIVASSSLDEILIARLLTGCRARHVKLSVVPPARGMFGTAGSGDTSGYGGLVAPIVYPGATQRPLGGWFDEVADALEERLEATDLVSAIERVVVEAEGLCAHCRDAAA